MNARKKFAAVCGTIILAGLTGTFLHWQNNGLQKSRYTVWADVKNHMRIIHLSDLHGKQFGNDNQKLWNAIQEEQPDLIVFTGDLADDKGKYLEETTEFICRLEKLAPTVYIPGNHEHRNEQQLETILSDLKAGNVTVLQNEMTEMTVCQNKVTILGLDENQISFSDYIRQSSGTYSHRDNSALFDALEQKEGFRLVLSHYPENFAKIGALSYQQYDFDLMLAGHAHGGQFRLPIVGPVFAPGQGLFPDYAEGMHGTRPQMIVSRGLGGSAFPFRLFNRPEIVSILVKPNS